MRNVLVGQMNPGDRNFVVRSLKLFDVTAMAVAFVITAVLPYTSFQSFSFAEVLSMKITVRNFLLFALFLLVWYWVFCSVGVYERGLIEKSESTEAVQVARAASYGTISIWFITLLFGVELMTPL